MKIFSFFKCFIFNWQVLLEREGKSKRARERERERERERASVLTISPSSNLPLVPQESLLVEARWLFCKDCPCKLSSSEIYLFEIYPVVNKQTNNHPRKDFTASPLPSELSLHLASHLCVESALGPVSILWLLPPPEIPTVPGDLGMSQLWSMPLQMDLVTLESWNAKRDHILFGYIIYMYIYIYKL